MPIPPEPRDDGLERPVCAAPPVVVEAVLHVVVVRVRPLHQPHHAAAGGCTGGQTFRQVGKKISKDKKYGSK